MIRILLSYISICFLSKCVFSQKLGGGYVAKQGIDTILNLNGENVSFSCIKVDLSKEEINIFEFISFGQEKSCNNEIFDEVSCDSIINNPEEYLIPYLSDFNIPVDSIVRFPKYFIAPQNNITKYDWMIYVEDSLKNICVIEQPKKVKYSALDSSNYHVKYSIRNNNLKTQFLLPVKILNYKMSKRNNIWTIYYSSLLSFYEFIYQDTFIVFKNNNWLLNEKKFLRLLHRCEKINKLQKKGNTKNERNKALNKIKKNNFRYYEKLISIDEGYIDINSEVV